MRGGVLFCISFRGHFEKGFSRSVEGDAIVAGGGGMADVHYLLIGIRGWDGTYVGSYKCIHSCRHSLIGSFVRLTLHFLQHTCIIFWGGWFVLLFFFSVVVDVLSCLLLVGILVSDFSFLLVRKHVRTTHMQFSRIIFPPQL